VAILKSKKEKFPNYDDFLETTKGKKYAPVYLFIGEEDFFSEECIDRVVRDLLQQKQKHLILMSCTEAKRMQARYWRNAASFPMMNDRRVVVIKEFDKLLSSDSVKELVSTYVTRPLESTCLVLLQKNLIFVRSHSQI